MMPNHLSTPSGLKQRARSESAIVGRVVAGKPGTVKLINSDEPQRHKGHEEITKTIFLV